MLLYDFRYKIMEVKQTNGPSDSTVQYGHGDSVVKNGCNGRSFNRR